MSDNLENLRQQIDQIDEQIFELLVKRLEFVSKVGEVKKAEKKRPILRPGREAKMIQKIYDKARESSLSHKVALGFSSIWRGVISSAINHEDDLKILTAKNTCSDNLAICREYMGAFTEVIEFASDREVIKQFVGNESNIGVLKLEAKYSQKPWWLMLSENSEQINIFARPPLINNINDSEYYFAISNIEPEPAENLGDRFIYTINADNLFKLGSANKHKIISKFEDLLLIESEDQVLTEDALCVGCYTSLISKAC